MTDEREEKRLWELVKRSAPTAAETCPEPLAFAAYAEGRASAADTRAVERHLAECAECLETLRDLRAVAGEALPEVSTSVRTRAKSLVATPARIIPLPLARVSRAAIWLALAASLVIVCLGGFRLGEKTLLEVTGLETDASGAFAVLSAPLPVELI